VASDLSRADLREDESLLIEAVELLVQRQRETESWVTEQARQAEERAVVSERRYTDLEARLVGVESQLERLMHDVGPGRSDTVVDERLALLREQVEGLKSRLPAHNTAPAREPEPPRPVAQSPRTYSRAERHPNRPARAAAIVGGIQSASFWEVLGSTPEDRFGIALIGLGAIAVLYAILTQLPLR
jgi:hypothetical protein